MASEWAEEADRQAQAVTRDLAEVGRRKGYRVTYQKREARFALRAGTATLYFSAHDYQTPKGVDWLSLRIDLLTAVRDGGRVPAAAQAAATEDEPTRATRGADGDAARDAGGRVGDVESAGETTAAAAIQGPTDTRPVGADTLVKVAEKPTE